MEQSTADFLKIIKVLRHHNVEFIVVGGVCAVLHGAPINTFDLDIVYNREEVNIDRLIAALGDLDVICRGRGEQRITPTKAHLAADGHYLLLTRAGPLDVLPQSVVDTHTTLKYLVLYQLPLSRPWIC